MEIAATLPAATAEEYERELRGARAALREAGFAAAWTSAKRGRQAKSLADTVRYALEAGAPPVG